MGCRPGMRPSALAWACLIAVAAVAAANVFTYTLPDAYLGVYLTSLNTPPAALTLTYTADALAVVLTSLVMLLLQSVPRVASASVATQWWLVAGGQAVAVAASVLPALSPTMLTIALCRALHGVGEGVYMIFSLILLIELSPKHLLGLAIALYTAGMTAADSAAPMLGAVVYDAAGIRAAFVLQSAVNGAALLLVLAAVPVWLLAPEAQRHELLQRRLRRAAPATQPPPPCCPAAAADEERPSEAWAAAADEERPSEARAAGGACGDGAAAQQRRPQQLEDGEAERVQRLDLRSCRLTLRDPVVCCQCLLFLFSQTLRNGIAVVLPVAMGTRTLVVGLVFLANVFGSLLAPFVADALLSRLGARAPSHLLSAAASSLLAAAALVVPLSHQLGALAAVLAALGVGEGGIDMLSFFHVAQRLEQLSAASSAGVGVAMFLLAQTAGGGVGSMMGAALLHSPRATQAAALGAVASAAALYGAALGVGQHRAWRRARALLPVVPHTGGGGGDVQVGHLERGRCGPLQRA